MNGIQYAPTSFSTFYETTNTSDLPYNDRHDATNNTETSCFLAPNTKVNTTTTSSTYEKFGKLSKLTKALQLNSFQDSIKQSPAINEQFLDFKKVLLPSMLMSINSIANKNIPSMPITASETEQELMYKSLRALIADDEQDMESSEISRNNLFKTAMVLLPTDSQWYLLNQLRIQSGSPERSDIGVEKLLQYYSYINTIEKRFPFDTKQVVSKFAWKDAFNSEIVSSDCIQFEKASVLFNLGAIFAQLGNGQRLWTPDGKKLAASNFQKAATVFGFIKDSLQQRIQTKSSDLSEITLSILFDLMLAQATECVYEKANDDKASSPVTSMIATQTADYYEIAQRHISVDKNKHKFPVAWQTQMKVKSHMFTAIAHFHAPLALPADKNVGERIARLQLADEQIVKAIKLANTVGGSLLNAVKGHQTIIANALSMANHANFEKHHQAEVDSRMLSALKRPSKSVLSPPHIDSVFGDLNRFPDIFNSAVTPNHNDEIKKFMNEYSSVLGDGKTQLKNILLEIDSCILVADVSNIAQLDAESHDSFATILHRGNAILSQLKIYHQEEDLISSETIIQTITNLINISESNIKSSIPLLDQVDTTTCSATKLAELSALRLLLVDLTERLLRISQIQKELEYAYKEDVLEFCPLGWSEDKIKALLPNVFGPHVTTNNINFKQTELTKKERDLTLMKIKEFKIEVSKNLEKLAILGTNSDLLTMEKCDISSTLESKRNQLRDITDFLKTSRSEMSFLRSKLLELSSYLESALLVQQETVSSIEIVESFEKLMKGYINYREYGLVELNTCIRLKNDIDALFHKAKQINDEGDCSLPIQNNVLNPLTQVTSKLSLLIPFSRNTAIEKLKKIPSDSKVVETYNLLLSQNLLTSDTPKPTEALMKNIIEKQQFELHRLNALQKKNGETIQKMNDQFARQQALSYESELASAPLDSFLSFNDSLKEFQEKMQGEILSEEEKLSAHERIRKGFMKMVGMKAKEGLQSDMKQSTLPRTLIRYNHGELSPFEESRASSYATGIELSMSSKNPTRRVVKETIKDNYVVEDSVTQHHAQLVFENEQLKEAMRLFKEKSCKSDEMAELLKTQNEHIINLQDRIQNLEKKKRGQQRSLSLSSVGIPNGVNERISSETKSDLMGWVEEQVKRTKSSMVLKNESVSALLTTPIKDEKRSFEQKMEKQMTRRKEVLKKDDVFRMDSGIGASRGPSSGNVIPSDSNNTLLKNESNFNLDGMSLRDTLSKMKKDNFSIAKQFGGSSLSSLFPHRKVQ